MTWKQQRRTTLFAIPVLLLSALTGLAGPEPAQAAVSTSITVNGTGPGRTFDGIGAISGGGGNSRLLADYPEPQRSELLDYLFKPGYGASLQLLKVEIGADTNTTDGAESSHMRTAGAVDCHQGYQWWLMKQAKTRNPGIKLAALSWGAPGWIGGGNFWSQDMIDYLMSWLGCAAQHGLTIDYLGGWNERDYVKSWYINLKNTLVARGHATKVVAHDSWGYAIADDMASDTAFRNAIDVIGVHYICGYNNDFKSCPTTATSVSLGKPLWSSEAGSLDYHDGAASVARGINRAYIDGKVTAYINWPLIAALYPNLYYSAAGMSVANQPWSGHYDIGKTSWISAHTSQFTQPGWRYLDSASGYLGGSNTNGSYVSLRSASNANYTSVIETMDAAAAQTATFTITGGLSTGQVHVWATNVKSDNPAHWFSRQPDITPSGGSYTLTLQPGYVYTVTTTLPAGPKGTATSPAAAPLNLPYADGFNTPATTNSPKYFSDMNGAFQAATCGAGRTGTCLRQMTPMSPIRWTDEVYSAPYTIMGDGTWSNYTVSVDTLLEQAGTVELLGRVMRQHQNNNGLNAYHLRVADTGAWSIIKTDLKWATTTLASGTTTALGTNRWHTLALSMQGNTITARIDGVQVGTTNDTSFPMGQVGLGITSYKHAQFDNLTITPGTDPMARTGRIASGVSGKCVNVGRTRLVNSTENGNPVQIHDCNTRSSQIWAWANGTLVVEGMCMDVTGQQTANLTPVAVWECNGGTNQKWAPQPDGTLKGVQSGRCLDIPGWNTTNGTQLIIYDCHTGANQRWTLP